MLIVEGRHTHGEPPDGCPQRAPATWGRTATPPNRRQIGGTANVDRLRGGGRPKQAGEMKTAPAKRRAELAAGAVPNGGRRRAIFLYFF